MVRGTCLPAPVSQKKVLKASSPRPPVLSLGIWPSGWIFGELVGGPLSVSIGLSLPFSTPRLSYIRRASLFPESSQQTVGSGIFKLEEDPAPRPKEKKDRPEPPLWFLSAEELDSLSSWSVCNLGVWCISMQQLSEPFLAPHFQSLLHAVVHAIDNPKFLVVTFDG